MESARTNVPALQTQAGHPAITEMGQSLTLGAEKSDQPDGNLCAISHVSNILK
jgi:hypothetical protein